MKIAIIVDNPLRDLYACSLLAAELSSKHDVFLISSSNSGPEIFQIWPDLVLLNQLRETNKDLVYKLIASGIAYSILDTEGGLFMNIPDSTENTYTITLPRDPILRNNLDQYYVWGNEIHADLVRRQLFSADKLLCLGTPRMDFFTEPLTNVISDDVALKAQNRPMILINTSFAGNNPRYSNKPDEMKMLVKKFSYTAEFIQEFFDNLDKAHFAYIDLTLYLAEQMPHADFVLRAHPFESEEIYKQKFAGRSNIKVILAGAAAEWILQSHALVHFECSTAIESAFLNVPVFSLSEFQYVRPLPAVQGISDYAASFAEMRDKLELVLAKKYVWPQVLKDNLKDIESRLYFKIDGLAYKRIANAINQKKLPSKTAKQFLFTLIYTAFYLGRASIKFLYKGTLIPEGKKIKATDLEKFLTKLSKANSAMKVRFKKKALSNIYKIVQ